jgi:hypothetical protein
MKNEKTKGLSAEQFRRLTGVKKLTFEAMSKVLQAARDEKKARGGRINKLSVQESLLMALEYLREYRTYFHISRNYGISEGYAYKVIRWVEDTLIKSKVFSLPGRKALLKSDVEYSVILVDASESPIQRPKKNSAIITLERRKGIRSKAK